jgi:ribose 5-phosphate isomerase A
MNDKELVAYAALDYIEDNSIIGLGTGSTADIFIKMLAGKISKESLNISVVASSVISQKKANDAGLKYISIDQVTSIDLYVDGADEITQNLEILKGRGFDLIREKLLAQMSKKFIVIGDNSKIVSKIGQNYSIPIEITPIAWKITKSLIDKIAKNCILRGNMEKNAFAISSYGNFVLDCEFNYSDLDALAREIANTPGVFEHGLFLKLATLAIITNEGKVRKISI